MDPGADRKGGYVQDLNSMAVVHKASSFCVFILPDAFFTNKMLSHFTHSGPVQSLPSKSSSASFISSALQKQYSAFDH